MRVNKRADEPCTLRIDSTHSAELGCRQQGSGSGSGQLRQASALVGGLASNEITTFLVEADAEAEAALKS